MLSLGEVSFSGVVDVGRRLVEGGSLLLSLYIYKQDLLLRNKMEKAIPNPKLFIFRKLLHQTFRLEEALVSSSMKTTNKGFFKSKRLV